MPRPDAIPTPQGISEAMKEDAEIRERVKAEWARIATEMRDVEMKVNDLVKRMEEVRDINEGRVADQDDQSEQSYNQIAVAISKALKSAKSLSGDPVVIASRDAALVIGDIEK